MINKTNLEKEIRTVFTNKKINAADKNSEIFIKDFVNRLRDNDIARLGLDALGSLCHSLWNLIQNRYHDKEKHRIYKWIPEKKSQASERLVVDIVSKNMPFLVDSLKNLLARYGLKPHIFIHLALNVQRNRDGTLTTLQPFNASTHKTPGFVHESVIHCQIREDYDSECISLVRQELPKMLENIRQATQHWKPITQKLHHVRHNLKQKEMKDFFAWIDSGHFVFLGYGAYMCQDKTLTPLPDSHLGIMNENLQELSVLFEGASCLKEAQEHLLEPLFMHKSSQFSRVRRCSRMDIIGVAEPTEKGKKIHLFLGLLTSEAYDSAPGDIPWLRQKMDKVIQSSVCNVDWHGQKALVRTLNSLPRDELFQASTTDLSQIAERILDIQSQEKLALLVRKDLFGRFLSCFVYVPQNRFEMNLSEKMRDILEAYFGEKVTLVTAYFGRFDFARVHYYVRISQKTKLDYRIADIEKRLSTTSESWRDQLRRLYDDQHDENASQRLLSEYSQAFTQAYQADFSSQQAKKDIADIEAVSGSGKLRAQIYPTSDASGKQVNLKVFSDQTPIHLSHIMPTLEHMGMYVLSEVPYKITPKNKPPIWLHNFIMRSESGKSLKTSTWPLFLETLNHVWQGKTEDDRFNMLVLHGALSWRQCALMRAYGMYLHQLQAPYGQQTLQHILARHGSFAQELIRFFYKRFDPQISNHDGQEMTRRMEDYLNTVSNATDDHVLRLYMNLVTNSLRANYFQKEQGQNKHYLSIKFDCERIDNMPLPRPMYEIFVYAPDVMGVHLRSGKVARGGLRWSDRPDDFRTEILGLMKAQVVKNTVIVPAGSKGGFVVKTPLASLSSEARYKEGVRCYQIFIQGLLDLTDNRKESEIVPPKDVVCHDAPDPYLVVAADKGTATFSDFANKISQDRDFWLDDAFASGGSAGYDHKKMGITARGAWVSVQHHFYGMGTDVQKDTVTVVGVGDMSGDVFGNGMLLSKSLKLVAAFNHMHIFIDPSPDQALSYKERERLFKKQTSQWSDYNPALISKGGGIFSREEKSISLSPQIKKLLGIQKNHLPPHQLVSFLLQAQVDLLWFGGVGTYIKSADQNHGEVGDRANDSLRIDANTLRCRVIGEGANLALTQEARIEFSKNGGCVNTDFIDNSAGVDTSDHEVNLKILLRHDKTLTLKERNTVLSQMTQEVAHLVLCDNMMQNWIISFIEARASHLIDAQSGFIRALEEEGLLDRKLEKLPDDSAVTHYKQSQEGFHRPELSILISYAKLSISHHLTQNPIVQDTYFETALLSYFPRQLQKKYKKDILDHPLRDNLILTYVVNEIVNHMGASFVHDTQEKTNRSIEDICRAYFVVHELLGLKDLWADIFGLQGQVSRDVILVAHQTVWRSIQRILVWWLKSNQPIMHIQETISHFSSSFDTLLTQAQNICKSKPSIGQKIPNTQLTARLYQLKLIIAFPQVIYLAKETKTKVCDVFQIYRQVGDVFGLNWFQDSIENTRTTNHWSRLALSFLIEDFDQCQQDITKKITLFNQERSIDSQTTCVEEWCQVHSSAVKRLTGYVTQAQTIGGIDLAFLTVFARELRQLF